MMEQDKMKTEKEWNLSDKIIVNRENYGWIKKKNVAEFIMRLKKELLFQKMTNEQLETINKLAGDKFK